jgi:hypothetical protein
MPDTTATVDRVRLETTKVIGEKGKLENADIKEALKPQISSIHPNHWDLLVGKREKEILVKMNVTDIRAEPMKEPVKEDGEEAMK